MFLYKVITLPSIYFKLCKLLTNIMSNVNNLLTGFPFIFKFCKSGNYLKVSRTS